MVTARAGHQHQLVGSENRIVQPLTAAQALDHSQVDAVPAERLLDLIAARCVPQRNFGWFGSFCWAGAAVRGMGEFAQRMKWEPICDPVEMKQGFSSGCHDFCSRFADGVAERFRR